jgi:hypothetical protein
MGQGYASIYVQNGSTGQAVTSTPAKVTAFATAGPQAGGPAASGGDYYGGSSGGNQDVVADPTNAKLKLRKGTYRVSVSLALKNLYPSCVLTAQLYKAGVALPGLFTRKAGTSLTGASLASGNEQMHITGLVQVLDADLTSGYADLDVRLGTPTGTLTVTPTYGQLAAVRIGE